MNDETIWGEVFDEIQKEIRSGIQREVHRMSMDETLRKLGPLPPEALLLGVVSDGLPALLNLHDPVPGPVLIVGDARTGKTNLLKSAAVAGSKTHAPQEFQYGVITNRPQEWKELNTQHSVGVFPFYEPSSENLLLSLASWGAGNRRNKQSILLILDGLENVNDLDFDARQNFRWLLVNGPKRRIWPVVTLDSNRMSDVDIWLDCFYTRIFGKVENLKHASFLQATDAQLYNLGRDSFSLREGKHWIRFWIPEV